MLYDLSNIPEYANIDPYKEGRITDNAELKKIIDQYVDEGLLR